jgi:hypothetical protein
MRGMPNKPVRCLRCIQTNACAKDQLCHSCRLKARPNPRKRFTWTTEFDALLVSAYRRAQNRQELSRSLTVLQQRSHFTRVVILARAAHLGLSFSRRRPWTSAETTLLQSWAGCYSPASIARKLGRTFNSVKAKVKQLEISVRVTEGYSQPDLAELFGVSPTSIRRWCRIGWLPSVRGRVPEAAVIRFLKLHPHEYQLRRLNEAWFKGLLFPAFNSADVGSHARGDHRWKLGTEFLVQRNGTNDGDLLRAAKDEHSSDDVHITLR